MRVSKDSRHGSAIGGRGPGRDLSEFYADELGARSTGEERTAKKTVLSQLGAGAAPVSSESPRQSAIAQKIQQHKFITDNEMQKIDHEEELTNRRNEEVQFEEYWNVNEVGGDGERRKEEKRK